VKHPVTPDRRDFVVRGRLWRMANSDLEEAERADLVGRLMAARRSVCDPNKRVDRVADGGHASGLGGSPRDRMAGSYA
jgi:hypothetical protein